MKTEAFCFLPFLLQDHSFLTWQIPSSLPRPGPKGPPHMRSSPAFAGRALAPPHREHALCLHVHLSTHTAGSGRAGGTPDTPRLLELALWRRSAKTGQMTSMNPGCSGGRAGPSPLFTWSVHFSSNLGASVRAAAAGARDHLRVEGIRVGSPFLPA